MNNDSISRSKLLNAIDPMYKTKQGIVPDNFAEGCMQMENLIKQQPTAYDADKAVKEMVDKRILELQMEDYGQGYSDGYRAGSNYRELGCGGCAFEDVEEWEMPCVRCKRGCKDYYRRAAKEAE